MSLFENARGMSLSFKSEGEEYTLARPWTVSDFLDIAEKPLAIRPMMEPESYTKWRKTHTKTSQALQLAEDSLATLGVNGEDAMQLLSALHDDKLFPLVEADLWKEGIELEEFLSGKIPLRTAINVFSSLNENASYQRKLNLPHSEWNRTEYILAEIADLLNFQVQLQHVTAQVSGWKPKSSTKPPGPIFKRPEDKSKKLEMHSTSDLVKMLKGQRGKGSS